MTDERTRKAAYRLAAVAIRRFIYDGQSDRSPDEVALALERIALVFETVAEVPELTVAAEEAKP